MNAFLLLLMLLFNAYATSCDSGKYPIYIERVFARFARDESFKLYQNEETEQNLILQYHGTQQDDYSVKDWTLCIQEGPYIIVMESEYTSSHDFSHLSSTGDGWGEIDHRSSLKFYNNGILILESFMPHKEGSSSYTRDTDTLYFLAGFQWLNTWYYTDDAQVDLEWTKRLNTSWNQGSYATIGKQTSLTRYYAVQSTIHTTAENILNLMARFYTSSGYVIYCNSHEIMRHHLPSGPISSLTPSTEPENITNYDQVVTIPKHYYNDSSTVLFAVEVHRFQQYEEEEMSFDMSLTPFYNDHFATYGMLRNNTHYCDPDGPYIFHYCEVISNDNIDDYFMILNSKELNYTVLTHPGKYIWGNAYAVTSSGEYHGDPTSWELYGSIDDSEMILLDIQQNVSFTRRQQVLYFTLSSSTFVFNKFYFHISISPLSLHIPLEDTTSDHLAFTEFQILSVNQRVTSGELEYPVDSVNMIVNVDPISIRPISSFYTNYTVEPELPGALTLHPVTGILSGYPTSVLHTTFTISAIHFLTHKSSSFSITITAEDCPSPEFISIKFEKSVGEDQSGQSYKVFSSDGTLFYSSPPLTTATVYTHTACIKADIYRFELYDTNGKGWVPGSLLTIYYKEEFEFNPFFRMTLRDGNHETYYVNTIMHIATHDPNWSFFQDYVPENWYLSNFIPSDPWETLDFSSPPSTKSTIWLFRNSFTLDHLNQYSGFEIRLKAVSGYIIYVNDKELYRTHIPSGLITNSTLPSHYQDQFIWITHSGPIDYLKEGTNYVSIAVINEKKLNPTYVTFNAHLLMLQAGESFSRFFGVSIDDSPVGSCQSCLTDIYVNDYYYTDPPTKNYTTVIFGFNKYRVEYGNKYCVTSSYPSNYYDPYSWTLSASDDMVNWTFLDEQNGNVFLNRTTTNCFYIQNNQKPWKYYLWNMTSIFNENVGYYRYAVAEFLLLNENLLDRSIPEFTITSSLHTTRNIAFGPVTTSSSYYGHYTIDPPLPYPLLIDTNTGNIRGVLNDTLELTHYTVTAVDIYGRSSTGDLALTVSDCEEPNVFFTIEGIGAKYAYYMSYYLKTTDGQIIDYQRDVIPRHIQSHYYCLPSKNYILELYANMNSGWESDYYRVLNEKNEEMYVATLNMYHHYGVHMFSMNYPIAPYEGVWKYDLYPVESITAEWFKTTFDDSEWKSLPLYRIPSMYTSITRYYRRTFSLHDLDQYGSVVVYVYSHLGVVAYLNGKAILRENLPNGINITQTTNCNKYNTELKRYGISFSTADPLLAAESVLAIETHSDGLGHEDPDFDASVSLTGPGVWMMLNGKISTNTPTSQSELKYIFDNNIDSVYYSSNRCAGTSITWEYENNYKQFVNQYFITNGKTKNERHPTGWILEGSNNEGKDWTLLHTVHGERWTEYNQTKTFGFYQTASYNILRFTAIECDAAPFGVESGFQVAEISYTSAHLELACKGENGYPDSVQSQVVYKECGPYYGGYVQAVCSSSSFVDEKKFCTLLKPSSIEYPSSIMYFYIGRSMVYTPVVKGAEYRCSIHQELPDSISFNQDTCSFEGKATTSFEPVKVTVVCSNSAGVITTTVQILSDGTESNNYIYVYAIMVLLFLVCVSICIKYGMKGLSKKNSGMMQSRSSIKRKNEAEDSLLI